MLTNHCFIVSTHESHIGFLLFQSDMLIKEWFNNKVTGIKAHDSATKLHGSKYSIQQQNYRDRSIWFAKISNQEGGHLLEKCTCKLAIRFNSDCTKQGDYTSSTKPHLHFSRSGSKVDHFSWATIVEAKDHDDQEKKPWKLPQQPITIIVLLASVTAWDIRPVHLGLFG